MAETTVRPTAARAPAAARRPRGRFGWAWPVLAAVLLATGAFLLRETRGTTFWFDEWQWVLDRRGNDVAAFLAPHNGHLSLVPVALYKLLFATAGLEHYTPYRVMVVAAHLGCVALLFAYARRRAADAAALGAAVLLLVLGPAWQNILWPFQAGWLVSLGAGIGALLALDRGDRRGDIAAAALLALALASSGLGVVIALGVAVELLVARGRRHAVWIAAAPLALYAIWWIGYQDTDFIRHNLVLAPGFAADAAAGAVAALTGLTGPVTSDNGATLAWGRPLAVAAAALVAWRVSVLRPVPPRVIGLLAVLLGFWLLTGVQRAHTGTPDASRYLYVGALFLLLLAAELARGARWSRPAAAALAAATGLAVLANLGDLREAGRYLRAQAAPARAVLGALEVGQAPRGHVAQSFPGYPFLVLRAGAYRDAAAELGSPAATPAQLRAQPEDARRLADAELVRLHGAALRPGGSRAPSGAPPAVDAATGGDVTTGGACVVFRPAAAGPAALELTLPRAGMELRTGPGPASVALRRFADGFPDPAPERLRARARATLRIVPDGAPDPWHVRVAPEARLTACSMP